MIVFVVGCADQRRTLPPPILRIGIPHVQPAPARAAPQWTYTPPAVNPAPYAFRNVTIVVDPGHGGEDPGTRGSGFSILPEKSINLTIAQDLTQILRSRGANAIITRGGDYFIELSDRAAKGNNAGASLFISVHSDASRNPDASGLTVYIGNNASGASERVAQSIVNAVRASGLECRGVKRANYKVLRESNGPAVLIECGFLTNFGNARALNTPYYRSQIASVIAQGIASYFRW